MWWPADLAAQPVQYEVVNRSATGDVPIAFSRRVIAYEQGGVFEILRFAEELQPGTLAVTWGEGFPVGVYVVTEGVDDEPPERPELHVGHDVFRRDAFHVEFDIDGEVEGTWTEVSTSPGPDFRRRVVTAAPFEALDGALARGSLVCDDAPAGLRGGQDLFWRARRVDTAGRRSPWSDVVHERTSGCATVGAGPLVAGWLVVAVIRRRRAPLRPA